MPDAVFVWTVGDVIGAIVCVTLLVVYVVMPIRKGKR